MLLLDCFFCWVCGVVRVFFVRDGDVVVVVVFFLVVVWLFFIICRLVIFECIFCKFFWFLENIIWVCRWCIVWLRVNLMVYWLWIWFSLGYVVCFFVRDIWSIKLIVGLFRRLGKLCMFIFGRMLILLEYFWLSMFLNFVVRFGMILSLVMKCSWWSVLFLVRVVRVYIYFMFFWVFIFWCDFGLFFGVRWLFLERKGIMCGLICEMMKWLILNILVSFVIGKLLLIDLLIYFWGVGFYGRCLLVNGFLIRRGDVLNIRGIE